VSNATYRINGQEHGEGLDEIVVGPGLDEQFLRVEDTINSNGLNEQAPKIDSVTH
jgi:hypothetical protein